MKDKKGGGDRKGATDSEVILKEVLIDSPASKC